jgi:D-alanyl-D-alanine carboxypeptidase
MAAVIREALAGLMEFGHEPGEIVIEVIGQRDIRDFEKIAQFAGHALAGGQRERTGFNCLFDGVLWVGQLPRQARVYTVLALTFEERRVLGDNLLRGFGIARVHVAVGVQLRCPRGWHFRSCLVSNVSVMIRIFVLVLCLASPVLAQPAVPDTPAGKVFTAWLTAFNAANEAQMRAFDATYQPDASPVTQTLRFRADTGGFNLLRIEKSEPTLIAAILEERDSRRVARLELEVTTGAQPTVASATLRPSPRPADLPADRVTEAEALAALAARIDEMAAGDQFSGAVLVGRHGKVLLQKAVGRANRDAGTPNTVDTRFRNGSMNKMFTAVATLQLVDAGRIALDDPVGRHLTDYPNTDVASKVTIRHLLTHTGGTGDFFGPLFQKNRLTLRTHGDYVALHGSRGLGHEPGAQFRYSNYGFLLLGAIIERVSGTSYFDYVRTKVYEPAGMTSTGSLPETEMVPNRAIGYMRRKDVWVSNADTLPWSGTSAGGGYSTVVDFFRFAEALQSGKLISKASLAQMLTPYRQQYGFGMTIQGQGAMRTFGHGGGAPGQNGELRVLPELGYVVVALSNYDPPAASRLVDFVAVRLPVPAAPQSARKPIVVDDFESGSLTGWSLERRGSGGWFVYSNGRQAPDPAQSDPNAPFNVPNPPQGKFAAVTDMNGPGTRIMYRDLKLDGRYALHMTVFHINGVDGLSGYSGTFASPKTLSIEGAPNQQFRIDLLDPSAPIDSVADADIRATVFQTTPGDRARTRPTAITFDLSRWDGQTVRLRFACVDNQGPMRAGVDDIQLVPFAR